MNSSNKINYIEFPATDIAATKAFFTTVFGWTFEDYGPGYTAFSDQGVDGGFYQSEQSSTVESGAVLVVLYSDAIESLQARIEQAGGVIVQPIFPFPGGRRFHFKEPSGNELAVWTDIGVQAPRPEERL
ncbi:Uncharacterised protein [Halioglobus japonicus]|nr:Uncharacterised protein [Halioglobus japonicus]